MKKSALFLMVVLSLFVLLVIISESEAFGLKSRIIGKWINVNGHEQIEFLKDGTVIFGSNAGDYKFIADNRLRIDIKGGSATVLEVSFDKEGALILKEPTGGRSRYLTEKAYPAYKAKLDKIKAEEERRNVEEQKRKAEEERRKIAEKEKRLKAYFTDNRNGTITVNETKLMWTKDTNLPSKAVNWNGAWEYVVGMNKGIYHNYGYTDWRLPTKKELIKLRESLKNNPYAPFITADKVRQGSHWSSTTVGDDQAWFVSMWGRYDNEGYSSKTTEPYYTFVWPVRGGQ